MAEAVSYLGRIAPTDELRELFSRLHAAMKKLQHFSVLFGAYGSVHAAYAKDLGFIPSIEVLVRPTFPKCLCCSRTFPGLSQSPTAVVGLPLTPLWFLKALKSSLLSQLNYELCSRTARLATDCGRSQPTPLAQVHPLRCWVGTESKPLHFLIVLDSREALLCTVCTWLSTVMHCQLPVVQRLGPQCKMTFAGYSRSP